MGRAIVPDIKNHIVKELGLRWMKLEPIMQSEVSQKEKHQYSVLMHIYDNPVCEIAKEAQMYRTVFWTLWEKEKVG